MNAKTTTKYEILVTVIILTLGALAMYYGDLR